MKLSRSPVLATTLAICAVMVACSSEEGEQSTAPQSTTPHSTNPHSTAAEPGPEQPQAAREEAEVPVEALPQEGVARFALINSASADIEAKSGSEVSGKVVFRPDEERKNMVVEVDLRGLAVGPHGLHIHERGDCSADDASSAGDHLNPFEEDHGGPESDSRHLGDLGNVTADSQGEVKTLFQVDNLSFSGPNSILQKAVIVHAGEDDFTSQPAGDSGDPVGCGVIQEELEVLADDLLE